jgi:hypothetical protein
MITLLQFLWNNAGTLCLVFVVLAGISILYSRVEGSTTLNDQIREEAAERWEAETEDDSIHNPFDAPEGMQPASQYVSVRTRR